MTYHFWQKAGQHEGIAFIAASRTCLQRDVVVADPLRFCEPHDLAAASPTQDSTTTTDSLAAGTVLSAGLSKQVDAKKYKVNDKVEARVVTDLLVHGQVVVHRNTKIIGHVTEVKASSKASPGSTVGIALDRMLLKGWREVPLVMMIQAIARPLRFRR